MELHSLMHLAETVDRSCREEEIRLIYNNIIAAPKSRIKEGSSFFVISQRWWNNWMQYALSILDSEVNFSSPHRPGLIDNDYLGSYDVDDKFVLKSCMRENTDFVVVDSVIWEFLYKRYGAKPILERKTICISENEECLVVELIPLHLLLVLVPYMRESMIEISKKETVYNLKKKAHEIFGLTGQQILIWSYIDFKKLEVMDEMNKTMDDYGIKTNQNKKLVLEFGSLIRQLRKSKGVPFIFPTELKRTVEKIAPRFVGSRHQDAQEFLTVLLDGLNRGMNLIDIQHVFDEPAVDGLTVEEMANEWWDVNMSSNESITSVFKGLLKSTLQCLECGKMSSKFDIILGVLSLPLSSSGPLSLYSLLDEFLKEEFFGEENLWHCPQCNVIRQKIEYFKSSTDPNYPF